MSDVVRVGVIGAGTFPQRMQIPALQRMPDARVVAITDANGARARECAERFTIPAAYTDYEAMLAAGGLDAVLVTTPNVFHAPATIAALEAGCAVLVEKPMAMDGDEAQRMADVARARSNILCVDFHRRFRSVNRAVRDLVTRGELGEVYQVSTAWIRRSGIPGYGSWFTTAASSGGGALLDVGVHVLDIALWVLGEPEVQSVSAVTSDRLGRAGRGIGQWGVDRATTGPFEVEDSVTALLRCAGGLAIGLDAAWAAHTPTLARLHLLGTRGGVVANPVGERGAEDTPLELFTDRDGEPVAVRPDVPEDIAPSAELLLRAFIASVRAGGPPPVPAEDGVRVARICDAIYESARTGAEARVQVDSKR